MSREKRIFILVLVLLLLAALAVMAYATALGPTGYSDSATYMVAGRNWAQGAGLGYQQPGGLGTAQAAGSFYTLTHYPPLYSVSFSLYTWLGLDLVEAGRWVNVLALVLALGAFAWLFKRHSRYPWLGLLGVLVFLVFPATSGVYASLMSDGPFLTLLILSLLAVLNYLQSPKRSRMAAAILFTASLPLIRYPGLFCVASAALILFLFTEGPARQRLQRAAGFAAAALLPVGLWLAWVYLSVDASLAGRGSTGGDLLALFQQFRAYFTDTIWAWIPFAQVPSIFPYWLRQLFFLALAASAAALALRLERDSSKAAGQRDSLLFWAFTISGAVYLAGLAAVFVLTTPTPDISDRILLPLFACGLGALLALAGLAAAHRPHLERAVWAAVVLSGALYVTAFAGDAWEAVEEAHRGQLGFFTRRWRDSETIEAVRAIPAEQIIVADRAAALLYWADRPAYELLEVIGEDLTLDPEQGDLLVLFDDFPAWVGARRGPEAAGPAADLAIGLQPLLDLADGKIYSLDP